MLSAQEQTLLEFHIPTLSSLSIDLRWAAWGHVVEKFAPERSLRHGKDIRVLIVDDKQVMLDLLSRILKRIGCYSVDAVQDGLTALDMLHHTSYGLVISDLHMAPLNGLDLLRKIRSDDKLRRTPFLMMSGEGNPYALIAAKHAGLDNFILKPFTPAALKEKLSGMLIHTSTS